MDDRKTKPNPKKNLRVTEDQQKIWDFVTLYFKAILTISGGLISISFTIGYYIRDFRDNKISNQNTLECQQKIDEARDKYSSECEKVVSYYTDLIQTIKNK